MFASVQSTVPFGMKILHIHGGETFLGSLDNILESNWHHLFI